MRKFLGIFVGLIILAVAAVLIGPGFVDWNNYKGELTRRVHEITGRNLAINGDIRIAVLPAPALVAGDISFANPDGAASRHMVTLKSAEVRVALGPLLSGQIKVETVKLIEPVIHLERLADGSTNWQFPASEKPAGVSAATPSGAPAASGSETLPAVALDNLSIENGTIIYKDGITGAAERIEGLNARIAAASLKGPMETSGGATVRGIPLTFDVNVGEIIHGRTVPFTVRAGTSKGGLKAQLGGTLVNLAALPKFRGTVKLTGDSLGAALASFTDGDLPPRLAQAFNISSEVTATAKDIELQKLEIGLGPVRATGDLSVDLADKPRISSRLEIAKIDLDSLLARRAPVSKPGSNKSPAGTGKAPAGTPKAKSSSAAAPIRFNLPKEMEASAILSVDAIVFRDGIIRDALVNAKLADGLLTVSQISAQFPGGSDLAAAVKLHTPGGVPAFSANLDSTVNDLRGVMRWLKVALPAIPADRLRKMSVRTQLSGTPEQVQISGLDLRFDSSRLTGGVTVALRDRLGFGANLTLDRFNLDAYLPKSAPPSTAAGGKSAANAGPAKSPAGGAPSPSGAINPFKALEVLTGFDANVKAHIKTLVHKANPIKNLVADATLYNGNLDIRRLSVGKFAGASATLRGKILGLSGVPRAKGLLFETKIADLNRVARLVGTKLPAAMKKLGAIATKGRVDGGLLRPRVDASTSVAGAVLGIKGRLSALPGSSIVDARLSLRHKDVAGLARRFGAPYRPAGRIGGIDIAADVKASPQQISVANLRATLGKVSVRGQADVSLAGPKPVIRAALAAGPVVIDPFLPRPPKSARRSTRPAKRTASPSGTATRQRATTPSGSRRFSDEPIDLSALHAADLDLSFASPRVAYGKIVIEKVDVAATVRDGRLSTQRLAGNIFEGKLTAALDTTAGPSNRIGLNAKVDGVNMAKSLTAVTGEALANGRMGIDLDVATAGRSLRDMIGALGGTAGVALTEIDVEKAGKGSMMSGLLGLLTSLNRLGGSNTNDRAAMTGNFRIARGVARTDDIKITSAYGNGVAAGDINLPAWTINMEGQMALAQNFVTQLLRAKIRESRSAVPFSIKGALDAPNVKVDTGALLGAGIPIPGADALLNKAPKGVGNILRGILGGGAQPQQPSTKPLPTPPPVTSGGQPAPADTPPPVNRQEAPTLKPEDLLKKLFKL